MKGDPLLLRARGEDLPKVRLHYSAACLGTRCMLLACQCVKSGKSREEWLGHHGLQLVEREVRQVRLGDSLALEEGEELIWAHGVRTARIHVRVLPVSSSHHSMVS